MPVFIILAIVGFALTLYIVYRASMSERHLFSVSLLALFGGLLFESFRISDDWKKVIYQFIGTYLFSLITFMPGKHEHPYDFESHIEVWPYWFIGFFAIGTALFNKEKVTAKLTEGITLLQSLSLIYWTIDYGFLNVENWFSKSLLLIALLFSAFSILHALTYIHLSKTVRLTLSIWSTIIMFAFAIDNIIRVFSNVDIESTSQLSQGLYIGLQYFLLGVSAVYVARNYILLSSLLPSKNGNYPSDLKESKKDHVDRYSADQVLIKSSLFCIVYAALFYGANYHYHFLPRHTMIWFVFLTFPLILQLASRLTGYNRS